MKHGMNRVLKLILTLLLASLIIAGGVYAEDGEPVRQSGSISVTKYEDNESKNPIEGVTFTIYQLTSYDGRTYTVLPGFESIFGGMVANGQIDPGDYDLTKIQDKTDAIAEAAADNGIAAYASVTTDADGKAVFTELPLGCWFVEETEAPDYVTEKSANFIVSVPMTNEAGNGLIYDISVYPKNVVEYTEPTPEPKPEPKPSNPVYTGISTQTGLCILIGTAALAAGIAMYTANRRKRQEG